MSQIADIHARQILDSRGNPTVEVDVRLSSGSHGRAAVPSGASIGELEAVELRDGTAAFHGKGVLRAVGRINDEIAQALRGRRADDQAGIDRAMIALDGTKNKERLGANATLGVSLACARAACADSGLPLWQYLQPDAGEGLIPMPMLNIINGGVHADNGVDFQEYMIVPVGAQSFAEALRMGSETYHALRAELRRRSLSTTVGDEGGFAPQLVGNEAGLELLVVAIERAGYEPGRHISLAVDPAASAFYRDDTYQLAADGCTLSTDGMIELWLDLLDRYPIVSLEDPLAEDDWHGWIALTKHTHGRVQLVGDDVFVSNAARLQEGLDAGVGNAILVKPNQVGTLTETLETIELADVAGYRTVISHRSGETEDTFIADLAVATGAGQIKAGAPARTERVAKYNQLLRIEEEMAPGAEFASMAQFDRQLSERDR